MTAPDPVVLGVAPTGARRMPADHPALPVTPAQLAVCAEACADEGASMVHLHVRDDAGGHTLDAGRYREATAQVRDAVGDRLLIQITTESAGRYAPEAQMAVVRELLPEATSLALRELVPDAESESAARAFLHWIAEARIGAQIILYDAAALDRLHDLKARGVVPDGLRQAIFVLGRHAAGRVSDPADLLPFLGRSAGLDWMCCAFGRTETACLAAAAAFGGHLRVGFENNIRHPNGRLAADNADQVRRLREIAVAMGRRPANPGEARALFGGRPDDPR